MQGYPGEIGLTGVEGEDGYKGEQGHSGPRGAPGLDGFPGLKGESGLPAAPAAQTSRGFVFTRHSQRIDVPECPPNTNKLWEGYSLASVIGSSRAVGQDLGLAGSCMLRFSTMPYLFCDIDNVCNYAQNNDDSLWLSTAKPMDMSMKPIPAEETQEYISRCAVCEARTRIIAIHSQSMEIPGCPDGWQELWDGYSYLMVCFDISYIGRLQLGMIYNFDIFDQLSVDY